MTTENNEKLEAACKEWRDFKRAEDAAKAGRLQVEIEIIELAKFNKLEGSETIKTNGHEFKISLTAKLDRKLDESAYLNIEEHLPPDMRPVRTKLELDVKGLKWLEEHEPDYYAIVAPCVTTKPAKTAVKIEFIGEL